ncbi:hypothetical protein KR018_007860, partial [Drosophila ironensis]
ASPSIPVIDKLLRFCFIGSTEEPVYAKPTLDVAIEQSLPVLQVLCGNVNEVQLVLCLQNVLAGGPTSEHRVRPEEPLLILAVFLSTCSDDKQRDFVRSQFPTIIDGDKELFLFMQLVKRVQKLLDRKTPFNRTVRKAVTQWYGRQSLDRLLHNWSLGDGSQWAAHKDLLHKCHYRDVDFGTEKMAALRLISTHPRELTGWPSFLDALPGSYRTIIEGVVELRLLEDAKAALPVIRRLGLSVEHVPVQMLSDPALAKFIMPRMRYDELLDCWRRVSRRHHSVRPVLEFLKDQRKLKAADMAPVRLLLEDMRNRKSRKTPPPIPLLVQKPSFIYSIYETSFGLNKALGQRLHITLNLENVYMGKYLTGQCRSLKYLDAVVAIAFGYFRSDPDVKVQFWTERYGMPKTMPWTMEMSLAEATECCMNQRVHKIKQSLTDILHWALEDTKNTYDLFLVLVPGAARGNPGNRSKILTKHLDEYREKRSPNAKFVVLSLRQHHGSMKFDEERNENLLELCSLDEYTPRLINSFAKGKFY